MVLLKKKNYRLELVLLQIFLRNDFRNIKRNFIRNTKTSTLSFINDKKTIRVREWAASARVPGDTFDGT